MQIGKGGGENMKKFNNCIFLSYTKKEVSKFCKFYFFSLEK